MPIALRVPFAEKDQAKALGARWNAGEKHWYVPDGRNSALFRRWVPMPDFNPGIDLPKERWQKPSLYVDLVPKSAWYSNLRSILTPSEWTLLRKLTYRRGKHRCEVCFDSGPRNHVDAHERWVFNNKTYVQTLVDMVCLCPACHEVTHMGLANVNGRAEIAISHLIKITGWTPHQAANHVDEAFDVWHRRSKRGWILDATWILGLGIELSAETEGKIRAMAAGGKR